MGFPNQRRNSGIPSRIEGDSSSSLLPSLFELVKNDEKMKELHDAVELELVMKTCRWSRLVLICGAGLGALLGYIGGEELNAVMDPLLLSVFGMFTSIICEDLLTQMGWYIASYILAILRHSLHQGCSASLVPAIYGFIPCACGFLFRTPKAVLISAAGVMTGLLVIFAVDLSGNCISEPIAPHQKGIIFADRFIPLAMVILGNSAVLVSIVRQSQNSLLVHAQASRSAAKLAEIRRDVLHRVTHELRTPLNGIVGSVDLLVNSESMTEYDMENALTLKRCLDSILGICDDVLMAAKEDLVAMERPFRLASCIDDVAEIFAATVEAKGIKLKVEFTGDTTAEVRGMAVKLRQVLLNLVGNALKFTETGSITIRVKMSPPTVSGKVICDFEVEDTGVGIHEQNPEMLFEPFHQGEQGAVSRRHKGTGLGLTICRDFVQMMGGNIGVDGKPGQGTRFYFTLEFKKEQKNVESETLNLNAPVCRIVLWDSEQESRTSCESLVRSMAPLNANIHVVQSRMELTDAIERKDCATNECRRLAFLQYDRKDSGFQSLVSQMKQSGWLVFVYCGHDLFPNLLAELKDAHAVFRRPLPLVRMGEAFRAALASPQHSLHTTVLDSNPVSPSSLGDSVTNSQAYPPKEAKPIEIERMMNTSIDSISGCGTGTGRVDDARRPILKAFADGATLNGHKRTYDELNGNDENDVKLKKDRRDSSGSLLAGTKRKTVTPEIENMSGSKIVVVDDTPINVKVMVKMLSRSTSLPIHSLSNGQAAIEMVEAATPNDVLLFLMDWHMPGVCGLTATQSIRRITQDGGGPKVFICMTTADIEGLTTEMKRRKIKSNGTVVNGELFSNEHNTAGSDDDEEGSSRRNNNHEEFALVDIVAGKPITFQSINEILKWFRQQVNNSEPDKINGAPAKVAKVRSEASTINKATQSKSRKASPNRTQSEIEPRQKLTKL